MDHWQTLSGHDGFEIKSLTPISRGYLFTELFGLDRCVCSCIRPFNKEKTGHPLRVTCFSEIMGSITSIFL